MGGSAQVLEYLSRYTHRTAISNERIVAVTDREVVLSVRADDAGKKRRIRLPGEEFIRRFMLHVLPKGIKRIRHYGLLASACKTARLAQARQALGMPVVEAKAMESAADFLRRVARVEVWCCPRCKVGRLGVIQPLAGLARLPAPHAGVQRRACRGPP